MDKEIKQLTKALELGSMRIAAALEGLAHAIRPPPNGLVLGITSGDVAIGARESVRLETRSQIPVHLQRLEIPTWLRECFEIEDLIIGSRSLFPSGAPVHAAVFADPAVGLGGELVQVSQNVSLRVRNTSGAPCPFRATFICSGRAAHDQICGCGHRYAQHSPQPHPANANRVACALCDCSMLRPF